MVGIVPTKEMIRVKFAKLIGVNHDCAFDGVQAVGLPQLAIRVEPAFRCASRTNAL
jgi:hypothetical protein